MNRWIKRTFIAAAGATALLGGIGAYAAYEHVHGMRWKQMTDADAAVMKARVVEKVGARLQLDATQKARLGALTDAVRAQRDAFIGGADPRADLQSLVAGPVFDRNKATAMIEARQNAVTLKSPALVAAMADFYDSLNATQQGQLRAFMASHRGGRRNATAAPN